MPELHRLLSERLNAVLQATNAILWELELPDGPVNTLAPTPSASGAGNGAAAIALRLSEATIHATVRDAVAATLAQASPNTPPNTPPALTPERVGPTPVLRDVPLTGMPGAGQRWLRVAGELAPATDVVRMARGTIIDVTAEYTLHDQLQTSRQQLADSQQLAGIGSWSWNLENDSVWWSPEMFRLLEVDPATVPSFELVLTMAVDNAHRTRFLGFVQAALGGSDTLDFELPAKTAAGQLRTVRTCGRVERDTNGSARRMIGTMQDVTALRDAERGHREREARFQALAESSPIGVYLTDADGAITYANPHLLDWFGYSFEAVVAGRWMQHVHADDLPALLTARERVQRDGHPVEVEYRYVRDGAVRWLLVTKQLIFTADGVRQGEIGCLLDITAMHHAKAEQGKLQARLRKAQQLEAIGLLAGGVAHDFNNLLVGILGNASLARDPGMAPSEIAEVLADIEHSAMRAAELTSQLLEIGGRGKAGVQTVDLVSLAEELPSLLGARIPASLRMEVVHGTEPIEVEGEATKLRQVLMNLVTNAVDAVEQRGAHADPLVRLHVERAEVNAERLAGCVLGAERSPGPYAVIAVSDSGVGMDADVLERMFDPFFTTKSSGRGLGLAATLGILRAHRAALDVRSAVGEGTVMQVLLPLSSVPRVSIGEPAQELLSWQATGTVLVVDDEPSVRAAARRSLERVGLSVLEASNGAEALDRYAEHKREIICIVLDLAMPVLDGSACFRALRQSGSDVPVLMSSGFDGDGVIQRLVDQGRVTFLQKPYGTRELQRAVRAALTTS